MGVYAVCKNVIEDQTMTSTTFGGRFTIWGLGSTHKAASGAALLEVVKRAREWG